MSEMLVPVDPQEDGPLIEGFEQPDWFKTAVFYEVLVRSFKDSNGDGVGDFRGLIDKLDYLQWLGVDCLWVPPFFSSPLRDGGYDISDYNNILPEAGTVDDFHLFLDEAHKRDIRVIIDFVMNHTSDQHPWFQASREDPEGPYGDFYVWSDTDELYEEARVIFVDTEPSNWTWDPVRQQYYWHRFFAHQPDLNFDNPKVMEAMLEAMSFWLDMGLDGFRLDAVPYLYERPGTNGENLPETHEALRQVRRYVDANYPGRVLLAEANQWPSDVVDYFGGQRDPETGEYSSAGDECHMCFHFPVMPRIFMAVRRENRFPISEILEQTPAIPDGCQWGIFLRNHDELTLEMVTDEDRDYMWDEYAKDPRMKANIGIRRRLAPLLDNDVNRMELFTALLLSLPGSPVLYYGDEIGMGDNIWLGDRDGVRTPMQWTPDRNAGFSVATPGKLHLPVNQDPVFGYQRVNVETELDNSSSLLHWTRRMIMNRKQHPSFGLGSFTDLGGSNPSVLSYVREHTDENGYTDTVLCVNNLSRFPQPVQLDLRRWEGVRPVELLGGVRFPEIGELPYLLTLGGYGFYWIRLPQTEAQAEAHLEAQSQAAEGSNEVTSDDATPTDEPLEPALVEFISQARWFGGKGRAFSVTDVRVLLVRDGEPRVSIALITLAFDDGGSDVYQAPVASYAEPQDRLGHAFIAVVEGRHVYDAMHDRDATHVWLESFDEAVAAAQENGAGLTTGSGLTFHRCGEHDLDLTTHSTLFRGEQSNSSVAFGDDALMKVFRRMTPGINPDIEIHEALTRSGTHSIAELYGWLELAPVSTDGATPDGEPLQLAMLQQFLRTASDGWELALASARNLFAEADLHADEVGGDFAGEAHRLGVAVSEVHEILREQFGSEPLDAAGTAERMRARLGEATAVVPELAEHTAHLEAVFSRMADASGDVQRVHGDLHLGQTLRTSLGWKLVDFEGEPAKPLAERRLPDSPWRDVAGMLRSFDYAAKSVVKDLHSSEQQPSPQISYRAKEWLQRNRAAFLEGYVERRLDRGEPELTGAERAIIDAYEADKAVYEVIYEARNRPTWVDIPLQAIDRIGAQS